MRTTRTRLVIFSMMGSALFGCPSDPPGDGFLVLQLKVMAAPVGDLVSAERIRLEVRRIDLVHRATPSDPATERVITIDSTPKFLDVALVDNNIVKVGILPSPPGLVRQIRFVFGDAKVITANQIEDLKTPSGEHSGLKLVPVNDVGFAVGLGTVSILEAQFDPNNGLVHNEGAGYLLKPTVPTVALASQQTTEQAGGIVAGEVLASFSRATSRARIDQILGAANLTIKDGIPTKNLFTLQLPSTTSIVDTIGYLERFPEVEAALPVTIPIDRRRPSDWGTFSAPDWAVRMSMQRAWDVTIGSERVITGVVEKGFNLDHPDLLLNVFVNEGELPIELRLPVAPLLNKTADCNADGIISMYDLNCLGCTVADASETPTQTCQRRYETARVAACARSARECIPAGRPITPSLLAGSMANGDDDHNGFPDDVVGWDFVDNDNNPSTGGDERVGGHGTEISGIIGAVTDNDAGVAGVAWRVRLLPLRTRDSAQGVYAIEYAVNAGARVVNYSRGEAYLAGPAPTTGRGSSYNGRACVLTENGTNVGANFIAGKRGKVASVWNKLDLSQTLLAVAPTNCGLDLNLDAGLLVHDWPAQWTNPSVLASTPGQAQDATGDVIALTTPGDTQLTLAADGGVQASKGSSTSYSTALVSGAAALVSARFPNLTGPCLRAWMTRNSVLDVERLVAVDGGIVPFNIPGRTCF